MPGYSASFDGVCSMEPAASWEPCEFQLVNWAVEEPAAEVWAPASFPVEYASIDIFGTCSLQAYVPESSGGQELADHYCSAISQHTAFNTVSQTTGIIEHVVEADKVSDNSRTNDPIIKALNNFKENIDQMENMMHRYPACLGSVDESYTKPRVVVIGPYHHHEYHHLRQVEVKVAAAHHCLKEGDTMDYLFQLVAKAADETRHLYDKDLEGINDHHYFQAMMLLDACFLVQYMLMRGGTTIDERLYRFLSPNRIDIFHDVMLLENQLPWNVVDTVMSYMHVSLMPFNFVYNMRYCMLPDYFVSDQLKKKTFDWNDGYKPPHLLGLLRYYIVGRSKGTEYPTREPNNILFSMSAIKLEKIGIKLTANKTYKVNDMRLNQEGTSRLSPKLSLAPLSLDRNTASDLINMAAFELCTVKSFSKAREEDSAVCSYLTLLSMLVSREEDVQQLRKKDLLQGGGLSDKEALRFFTSVQGMRLGPYYTRIMQDIEYYREKKWLQAWLYEFYYSYGKIIGTIVVPAVGIIGTLVGIIVSIMSHKHA